MSNEHTKTSSENIANYADRLTRRGVLVDPAMDDTTLADAGLLISLAKFVCLAGGHLDK